MYSFPHDSSFVSRQSKFARWPNAARRAMVETLEARMLLSSIVVNTLVDSTDLPISGIVSLRDAITTANASATPTTITFDPTIFAAAQTITLRGTALVLRNTSQPTTITGPAAGVTVNGNFHSDVFDIEAGVTAAVSGVTIANGYGNGINNFGNLTLSNASIVDSANGIDGNSGNTTATTTLTNVTITGSGSDGIDNNAGNNANAIMTLTNVTISGSGRDGIDNFAAGDFAAGMTLTNVSIAASTASGMANSGAAASITLGNVTVAGSGDNGINNESGTATLAYVTVSGGNASGIVNSDGTATLRNVTVADNTVAGSSNDPGYGGGIDNDNGNLTLTQATISGNTISGGAYGDGYGGGFYNNGNATLSDVTIANNSAPGGSYSSYAGGGGGIYNDVAGNITLINVTVSGNAETGGLDTSSGGGGIYNDAVAANFAIGNTIVAGDATANLGPDVYGNFTSLGNNLIGKTDGSGGWISTDLTGTAGSPLNANLGALADNGGPTQTLLPQTGSAAIAHGATALIPNNVNTDQRDLPRIYNNTVDIGAVEVQPAAGSVEELVYRLYSPVTLEHLLTTDVNEYTTLATRDWNQEGPVFNVYTGPIALDGVWDEPLYRLYNIPNEQHLWTTDPNEYDTLKQFAGTWSAEGIVGYVFPTAVASSEALYRLSYPSPTDIHLWTTDQNEVSLLTSQDGWILEEITGYVLPVISPV